MTSASFQKNSREVTGSRVAANMSTRNHTSEEEKRCRNDARKWTKRLAAKATNRRLTSGLRPRSSTESATAAETKAASMPLWAPRFTRGRLAPAVFHGKLA